MPSSLLDTLVRICQLKAEPPAQVEFEGLLRSGKVRLADARNLALGLESRFDLGCNAAHALSSASLRLHGYPSENRHQVFQCLTHVPGMEALPWRVVDQAHRKHNLSECEGVPDVDTTLAEALIRASQVVADRVEALGSVPTD